MNGPALFQGEIITKKHKYIDEIKKSSSPEPLSQFQPNYLVNLLTKFKNLLLLNQWANFNQTLHKASLGEGDSSLFKWGALPFSKSR